VRDRRGTPNRLVDALCRTWFRFSTLSGCRSIVNRLHSRRVVRPRTRAAQLTGRRLMASRHGLLVLHVHMRSCPLGVYRDRLYGVVSARFLSPPISRFLYRYLCWTSHFGVGHVEAAFYVEGERCVVYAVRNIARAHALRLGMKQAAGRLAIARREEDVAIFRMLSPFLEARFAQVAIASSAESIVLAVDQRLLHPATRDQFLALLRRRANRLSQRVEEGAAQVVPTTS